MILGRNIDCRSIFQKTLKQFGPEASNNSENLVTRTFFSASHFADEFVYVARYDSPECVSAWFFIVETLSFFPEI